MINIVTWVVLAKKKRENETLEERKKRLSAMRAYVSKRLTNESHEIVLVGSVRSMSALFCILRSAYQMKPKKPCVHISAGFAATGTWPVNTDIFGEADFLPSQVTDRILPNPEPEQSSRVQEITVNVENRPHTPNSTIGTIEFNEARALTQVTSNDQATT
ncbi:hypothetical protein HW555_006453 [Spodoptera exigua]|uniref:Uncharacterized protein n=1 Tax=Spodoptera exigua TaxID=7107 RepID=A0A835GHR6_SPOEX|nr:hypothetical protein HW555_006453 [Spodoptera exigua]